MNPLRRNGFTPLTNSINEQIHNMHKNQADLYFNVWSHQYVYKYKTPEMGRTLYQEYSAGTIRTEQDFLARLRELEAI